MSFLTDAVFFSQRYNIIFYYVIIDMFSLLNCTRAITRCQEGLWRRLTQPRPGAQVCRTKWITRNKTMICTNLQLDFAPNCSPGPRNGQLAILKAGKIMNRFQLLNLKGGVRTNIYDLEKFAPLHTHWQD